MGETILANTKEERPDILFDCIKAFKSRTKETSQPLCVRLYASVT
jgi:hypothetical protein